MENTKPFIILDLDKPRRFRFDLDCIIEFDERTGINFLDPATDIQAAFTKGQNLKQYIYLGLKTSEENVDVEEKNMGKMLDQANLAPILMKLTSAFAGKNVPRATIPTSRRSRGTGNSPSKQPVDAGSSQKSSTS